MDKFIGDGMMVLWGAPMTHSDDASRAVKAAMDIQKAIQMFNHGEHSRLNQQIQAGIGIDIGTVVAGYIGSSRTMSYSVIGDTVNTASRLCAAALPGEVVISESMWHFVHHQIPVYNRKPVQAKGKGGPNRCIFRLGVHAFGIGSDVYSTYSDGAKK